MSNRWSPFIKQLVVVAGLAGLVWFVLRVQQLLTPLTLALLVAFFLSFPVGWIVRKTGWHRTTVTALVYLVALVILVTAPVLVIPRIVAVISSFYGTLSKMFQELVEATPKPITLGPSITIDLGPYYHPINQWLTSTLQLDPNFLQSLPPLLFPFASSAAVVVKGAVYSLFWSLFILVVSFYLVKDSPWMGRYIARNLPDSVRYEARRLWEELAAIWDSFVLGQIIVSLSMGGMVWLATTILGIRSAPALAGLSAMAEFIPGVGPFAAAAVGVLVSLFFGSTWIPLQNAWFALLVALIYLCLSQFKDMYLAPRIVGSRFALHPVVIIVGALAGAQLAGVLGLLLAAPAVASARTFLTYAYRKIIDEEPFPRPTPPDQRAFWQGLMRDQPIAALLFDLDGTLIETDDYLQAKLAHRLAFLKGWFPSFDAVRMARSLLMFSDLLINELLTLLNQLRLAKSVFRFNDFLRKARAYRPPTNFVVVEGAVPVLHCLAERYTLGVVTSRDASDCYDFLAQYNLASLFKVVITRDEVKLLKPHPAPVNLAAKRLGLLPAQCVMIGDTTVDVRSAKAAGALMIGVLSGFGSAEDLNSADLVIPSVASLGEWM
jgi:HAD superfamily hydrolase (TIGR01549 family)